LKSSLNIEAIIPAAGYSSRAGGYKPLMGLCGRTVIQRCLDGMYGICSRIIVVGGYGIEKLAAALNGYTDVVLIENPRYPEGMFTSIKAGLQAARGDRIFITPADHPLIRRETYQALLGCGEDIVVPTFHGSPGHPALIASDMVPSILEAPDTYNLRDFITQHGFKTMEVDDEAILLDLDTPADYSRMLAFCLERGNIE
jgi:molybdenum cofactor cytidylyltransferase